MLGADVVLKCLERHGVKVVFGLPGGAVIPLYDRLKESLIEHILVKHEQGAVHAADGYARATGEVGVCFATSGPGATNLMTGIANAQMDSIPIICITGQVAKPFLGKDSFQEAFIKGITEQVAKYSVMVSDAKDIPETLANAFFIAKSGRPGPVVIDIPKDLFLTDLEEINLDVRPAERYQQKLRVSSITKEQIRKVLKLLESAKKPLIVVGGGVNTDNQNRKLLESITETLNLPTVLTLMGKGLLGGDNPWHLGMVGMHGTTDANYAIQHCDVLLAIGMRFDDRVTSGLDSFAQKAKIIHVDIDAAEIGKNVDVEIPIVGDAHDFLEQLHAFMEEGSNHKDWLNEIRAHHRNLKKCKDLETIPPLELFTEIDKYLDENTIIVTDVGQHQMWSALFLHPERTRQFITSGGLGTMGYGLPAAIGAQFGKRKDKIVLITGDGSFQMNMQELAVVKEHKLPIKIVLINNGYLGMVRQWQEMFHNKNYSQTTLDVAPHWEMIAGAYDISYERVNHLSEVYEKLGQFLTSEDSVFIDIRLDPTANVFPMVPGGKDLDKDLVGDFEDET